MSPQMGAFGQAEVLALLAAHAALVNAHHAQVHGAAQHNDVTRELFLPANEGYGTGTPSTGLAPWVVVIGGANLNEPDWCFAIKVPDDFVSFTKVEAVWMCAPAAGNMYWYLNAMYAASGQDYNEHSDVPVAGVTATAGVWLINVQEPANPLTLVDLAIGDYLGLRFRRSGANALDTLDSDVYFLGLLFTYVASQ